MDELGARLFHDRDRDERDNANDRLVADKRRKAFHGWGEEERSAANERHARPKVERPKHNVPKAVINNNKAFTYSKKHDCTHPGIYRTHVIKKQKNE